MEDIELQELTNQAAELSVQFVPDSEAIALPILSRELRLGQIAPPWWSPARDAFLREFWRSSDHLSTVMYTAQSILTGIPVGVAPKDPTITAHVEEAQWLNQLLFHASEFGDSLHASMSMFVLDYLSTDNGGFLEIIGGGNKGGPIVGRPLAVAHLDSQFCWRTGNPEYPVVYFDPLSNERYKLHASRVLYMSQMPSPERPMLGVGLCAVSRVLQVTQNLLDIYMYKQEKLGSRPVNTMLVGKGYSAKTIIEAVGMASKMMDRQGLSRYSKVIAIGNMNTDSDIAQLDLNKFDPFDEEIAINYAMYVMANAFGIPISEVWAYAESGATRTVDTQLSRQRGKLPTEFSEVFGKKLGAKYLPEYLQIVSDYTDDTHDERKAVIRDIRARNRERDGVQVGVLNIRTMREQMLADGEMTREQFVRIELSDGRLESGAPVQTLFYSRDPMVAELLDLDVTLPTVVSQNDASDMLRKIDIALARVMAIFTVVSGSDNTLKLYSVYAALESLRAAYAPKLPVEQVQPVSRTRDPGPSNPGTVERFS